MKDKGAKFFYKTSAIGFSTFNDALELLVDDFGHDECIDTPKNWKCEEEGCLMDYKHEHSTSYTKQ